MAYGTSPTSSPADRSAPSQPGRRRDRVRAASSVIDDTGNLVVHRPASLSTCTAGYGMLKGCGGDDLLIVVAMPRGPSIPGPLA